MGVAIETVLVPVDASEQAERALEYALAIAEKYDAGVHALYVLDETVTRGLDVGELTDDDVADEHATFVEKADALADRVVDGVALTHSAAIGFSPSRLRQHPGSVVLDVAEDVDADFVVVPREPISGDPDEVIGKSAQYVLEYASQPVLSV